jgi:hypothetical protein
MVVFYEGVFNRVPDLPRPKALFIMRFFGRASTGFVPQKRLWMTPIKSHHTLALPLEETWLLRQIWLNIDYPESLSNF